MATSGPGRRKVTAQLEDSILDALENGYKSISPTHAYYDDAVNGTSNGDSRTDTAGW